MDNIFCLYCGHILSTKEKACQYCGQNKNIGPEEEIDQEMLGNIIYFDFNNQAYPSSLDNIVA